MFYFGWVKTHLRVVLGDVYGLFWVFELDFWKNGQMSKIWAFLGALRRGQAEWEADQASGLLRCSVRRNVAVLCGGEATVHSMENCYVLVLFHFRCSKDSSIEQMRTL